jgi:hypothetical protein
MLAWGIKHDSHGIYFDSLCFIPKGKKPQTDENWIRVPWLDELVIDFENFSNGEILKQIDTVLPQLENTPGFGKLYDLVVKMRSLIVEQKEKLDNAIEFIDDDEDEDERPIKRPRKKKMRSKRKSKDESNEVDLSDITHG